MDYYIVRIYRREKGDPDGLVGTVEAAGNQERRSFRAPGELWDILSTSEDEGAFGKRIDKGKSKKKEHGY